MKERIAEMGKDEGSKPARPLGAKARRGEA